jgi:hypothetical protein
MGQTLCDPPDVAGWDPGSRGSHWRHAGADEFCRDADLQSEIQTGDRCRALCKDARPLLSFVLDALSTAPLDDSVRSELANYLQATGPWTASAEQLQAKVPGLVHLVAATAEYQFV